MVGEVTFGVIGLLFLFADIRTFATTFQQTFFGAPTTTQAVLATAVFATSFLAILLAWRLGPRRALGISGAIFAVATFLCAASRNNWTDLALSVVALAAGFWWLAFLQSARVADGVSPLARALPIAFAIDLGLRAAFRTIAIPDLAWPVAVGIVLVGALVFVAAGLASMPADRRWTSPDPRGFVGLLVLPCLVLVAETGATNGAQIAAASGLGLGPEPARSTQIGQLVVGLGIAAGAFALTRASVRGPVAALAIAAGAALLWAHLPVLSLAGGALLAAGTVVAAAALLGSRGHPARSPLAVIVALSFGWLLFAGGAFGFYAFWAYLPAVWAATALVVLGAVITAPSNARVALPVAIAVMALAVAAPLAALLTTPVTADPQPAKLTFRVMTYNIHQGFDAGQIPSLDALVDTISREGPDVVLLQEVVRGWMIDEQQDTLSVLAERLGMQYAFLPNIGDLYGDAVLSRFAMTDVRQVHYALEPGIKHQPRGALFVRIADVLFVCTHLDEVSDGTFVRQEQVRTIIREIGDASPVIVAGDLNATPEDIEVRLLNEFGLDDLGAPAGDTSTGDDPQKRIDYIWGRGLIAAQAHTVSGQGLADAKRASDHRPLIVNVTVQKK